jgi:hypothetical protein
MNDTLGDALLLRISGTLKKELKDAAASVGQSMTTFVTDAITKRVEHLKRHPPKGPPTRGVHGGVPSFFRANCMEAARGGANGYQAAGWHLANAICSGQEPYEVEEEEWEAEVEALKELLESDDVAGVWGWFKRHYPKCMALVPIRRREQFVAGVKSAYEEERFG